MAEDLATSDVTPGAQPVAAAPWQQIIQGGYIAALSLLTLVLLLARTEPAGLWADGGLFVLFLVISMLCGELGFALGPEMIVNLASLFGSAAVLTLGFNGVWVPTLTNLFWIVRKQRPQWQDLPLLARLGNYAMNLSMNALPPWLALFAYHDLVGGDLPLADLGLNLGPALAFVTVEWLVLTASLFLLLIIAQGGVGGGARWFKGVLTGFALTVYVPVLFSPAVAVILNRLGVGFFLFVSAGLLGISLMAQRLALALATQRRRVEELTALNALSDDIIHHPPGVETTGQLLARHGPRFLPDADFELCLFDPDRPERRQVIVDWRAGAIQPAMAEAPWTPAWAWLRDRHRSLHLADTAREPLPFPWQEQDGPLPGALLLVPLLASDPATPAADRCIGGILIQHARPNAFAPEALPSVTALANQMAAALENARLHQEALARERLERELALARGIQTSFLPADVPHLEGWEFVASLEPARQVSGDFYDFIPLPGERWGLLIADVADKGMPAALYMALARTLIRAHAPEHAGDPAACLGAANDQILADTQSDLFVTVFYGILDPAAGEMVFCNAGHNPPYLCRGDGRPAEPLANTGMALGVLPGVPLDKGRTRLETGDDLVLYTDGVVEAHDPDLYEFGNERLLAVLEATDGAAAETRHRRIRTAVAEFVGEAPQFDDLTLIIVSRK
jgi:sigma-B regulation protein RsbU (phosphoserine phosphatase)